CQAEDGIRAVHVTGVQTAAVRSLGLQPSELCANEAASARIDPRRYVGGDVGLPTIHDILDELRKPGRDPRDTFEMPRFRDDVREMGRASCRGGGWASARGGPREQ